MIPPKEPFGVVKAPIKKKPKLGINMPTFWVYILYCSNGSLYTGYTSDLILRYKQHVQGIGAKYTRSFKPLYLVQAWPIYGAKGQAMMIENLIKKISKENKKIIIDDPGFLEQLLILAQS
jgi:putative endonuclease